MQEPFLAKCRRFLYTRLMEKLTRAQQAEKTKNHIFETALRLFQIDDYDKVTIGRICREAGVSVGNFYHYFKSKEQVLMEKYIEFDTWLEEVDYTQDVEKIILDMIHMQTEGAKRIGSKVFVKVMQTHLSTSGKYISSDRRFNDCLSRAAYRGIEEGMFSSDHTPQEIADAILRTSRGVLFDWATRGAPYDVTEVSRHDVLILLRGFR